MAALTSIVKLRELTHAVKRPVNTTPPTRSELPDQAETTREENLASNSRIGLYPINSGIGWPWLTMAVGRPLKSLIRTLDESIPKWW